MLRFKAVVNNTCFLLCFLLIFLLIAEKNIHVPAWLQVAGRMHPLILHFPLVLLFIAVVLELLIGSNNRNNDLAKISDWVLLSASFFSILTVLFGLLLSKEEGYTADGLFLHKWSGVVVALISYGWYIGRNWLRKKRWLSFIPSTIAVVALIITGHQGASITHGENFLLAPVSKVDEKPVLLASTADVFQDIVQPILKEKCMSCHNNTKAKGELTMETEADLLRGGKNGKLWDSTETGLGLLLQRLHMPMAEKKHMPPKEKPQLTDEELAVLYQWIKNGAAFTQPYIALAETDSLRLAAAPFINSPSIVNYTFAAADEAVIQKLNNSYRVVALQATGSPAITVSFFGPAFYSDDKLKELEKIKEQIVEINLARMPVKDEALNIIAQFPNLEKLNLSFTNITGNNFSVLKDLTKLRLLSIAGTAVQPASLSMIRSLSQLNELFVWNTSIKQEDITSLKKEMPSLLISTGFKADTVYAKLNVPAISDYGEVFTGTTKIALKHFIKNVAIRYTLDGTEPDSASSPLYKDSIAIDKSVQLKAKAYLPGWESSEVAVKKYFKSGFIATTATLEKPPNPNYAGIGGVTLINREKGELNFKTKKWLGFRENEMVTLLSFDTTVEISNVSLSTLVDIGSYVMPASKIEVWGGEDSKNMKKLVTVRPQQPVKEIPGYILGIDCEFKMQRVKVLRIVAWPVANLPPWHRGKGDKGWFFVDEIFVN